MKTLIISADDFGYSKVFNDAILELAQEGKISNTSVLVHWVDKSQEDQIKKLREIASKKDLSLGLHVEARTENPEKEIIEQLQVFQSLFGFLPDNLDFHKFVHEDMFFPAIMGIAKEYGMTHRNRGYMGTGKTTEEECVIGTDMSLMSVSGWLANLEDGVHEIFFHPGHYDPESHSTFNREREEDVKKIELLYDLCLENDIRVASWKTAL